MAAAPPAGPIQPEIVSIPVSGSAGIGDLTITPPTFLEKWGVVFVAVAGGWILVICACMLWYYLEHLPAPPPQTPATAADAYKTALDLYKTAGSEFRDSLSFVFDLTVTKTILPLVTLLLRLPFRQEELTGPFEPASRVAML